MAVPGATRFGRLAITALLVPAVLTACGGPILTVPRRVGHTTVSPAAPASTPLVPIDPDPVPVSYASVVRGLDAAIRRSGSVRYRFAERLDHSYLVGSATARRTKTGWSSQSTVESGLPFRMSVVSVPGKAYIGGLPGLGKNWAVVSKKGTDPLSRLLRPQFDTLQLDADPAAVLRRLPLGTVQLEKPSYGYGDIVYEAELTGSQVLPLLGPALSKRLAGSTPELSAEIRLWVAAANGLPSTLHVGVTVDGVVLDVEVTYTDWGTPVTVTVPPRSRQVRVTKIVRPPGQDQLAV